MPLPEDGSRTAVDASPTGARPDRIRLVLPADPAYGRIARVATSSLALRLGFTFAEIEDLRIAVDETVILLLRPEGDSGQVTLEFSVEDDRLTIDASTTAGTGRHRVDVGARRRFEEIVADTVDFFVVDTDAPTVRLVKHY